ncbi:MAG: glycosyltransferase family 4 protein [Rhodospirillales bacterium]|nr:glycosyltransferase family 4 protein [Rhodospirillales bacterium]
MPSSRPTLVFLLMEDWFFASHFWARGLAAQKAGWRVVLISRQNEAFREIEASGIEFYAADLNRKRLNPFKELAFSLWLARLYRRIKPDVVHHIALKPIIFGGIAARLANVPAVVNAPIGLGFVYSSDKLLAKLLKPLVTLALRTTMSPKLGIAVFENPDDLNAMADGGMVQRDRTRLIRGAGVDIELFAPSPEPEGPIRIALAARMIQEKGIPDFVAAARLLKGKAEFWLAGAPDLSNPNPVREAELRGWEAEGIVKWLGPVKDMAGLLHQIHIFSLPSTYREGLPKAVLEAMAAGLPVVATDIPGCREAVVDGETGFLVPARSPEALADALDKLITNPGLRAEFGAAGRKRVLDNFSDEIVCQNTMEIYKMLKDTKA